MLTLLEGRRALNALNKPRGPRMRRNDFVTLRNIANSHRKFGGGKIAPRGGGGSYEPPFQDLPRGRGGGGADGLHGADMGLNPPPPSKKENVIFRISTLRGGGSKKG